MSYLMGIDVGTTGTRVVIVRPDGHVMGAATGDHEPMRMPKPGWAEQDPENWWQATVQAVRAVFERTGLSGKDIAAVGLSGQMHGVVLLDKSNAVLHPALLPRAYEAPEITGQITRETSLVTGLTAGTPVVAGGGDQASSAVGNGIVLPGLTSATLGSSGVIFSYTAAPKLDPQGRIHTFCHAVPGKWHVMGVTQGAGLSLRWFREHLGESETWYARQTGADPYDLIINEAEKIPPGSDGLLFLPYLMGERTPHLDAQAREMWFGVAEAHTRGHLIRSVLEGVAFSLRDSLEIFKELEIPVQQIRASGGGSRSSLWRQIQADIYGKELVTLQESEGSDFAAALLAGVGGKIYSSVEESAKQAIRLREHMTPDPDRSKIYD